MTTANATAGSSGASKGPRSVTGRVVSAKMKNTVVVAVEWTITHPQYKKVVRRSTRYMAHDDRQCGLGDVVRLVETRPLSKRKRWRVVAIVERATAAAAPGQESVAS
ncbi:MAG: 30S ribosomal protein S17 [Nitrospirota bacterium]